jgi:glycosyltransferase involved in cell wall biosynthesis
MTHIFLNGLGANAGAGLTYLYNVVPILSSLRGIETTLALQPQLRGEFGGFPQVNVLDIPIPTSTLRRFWFEQRKLRLLVLASGADVVLSTGNFALRNSPVPQILLSGNSLYTSTDFYRDLRRRQEYAMWLDTKLKGIVARRSVHWADYTVAPSQVFAAELHRWTGKPIYAIHHGFDPDVFFADTTPLLESIRNKLIVSPACLKLLFVSHYNYYRNFETLFRAIPLLRERVPERPLKLFLTCTLQDDKTPGVYKTARARRELEHLGIASEVIELGAVPYHQLHKIYRASDIYVTAAYAETFAHPLVEAMASGLPIVASDIAVHREVCGDSASYFPPFSAEMLADRLLNTLTRARSDAPADDLQRFSWADHVKQILSLAARLQETPGKLVRAA